MKTLVIAVLLLFVAGCVNRSAVLVNEKGEVVDCSASGFGIISGTMASNSYNQCVSQAQMRGYRIQSVN